MLGPTATLVTGFADQWPPNQISACECSSTELDGEPRIFRVYDAYEVLANLRIFHNIFFPSERHIQELRFPNTAAHSMKGLTFYLMDIASATTAILFLGIQGNRNCTATESCTAAFFRSQRTSCEGKVTEDQWLS